MTTTDQRPVRGCPRPPAAQRTAAPGRMGATSDPVDLGVTIKDACPHS
jgi:hypothetical protein